MNGYQILGLIIIALCLYNIYIMEKYTNLEMKLHNKYKDLIIKKNKEIDKLEKQIDLLSDQYLKLREDYFNQEKIIKALEDELFKYTDNFQKEWNQKYEG